MKKNNKGFTLVELLAVITIIGILLAVSITAVIHFINKAKDEQRSNQEKTVAMAAENYLQENRGQLPKNIGETTTIPISILKNNKYLTENIKNANGESCMTNSYVTAYKESKTKYVYKAHLYCGDEEKPDDEDKVTPTIAIDFVDGDGNSIKNDANVLNKVSEAKFTIEFGGGTKDDKKIAIDGYSYSILTKVAGEASLKEVYSSGTLSANRSTDILVDRDNNLKDYIDISTATTVAIKATVRNVDGGINDKVAFIGADTEQAEVVYYDNVAPNCVAAQTKGEPSENSWININSTNKERKITVVCSDGSGSGCIRSTFTKTWPNNSVTSAEYDTIEIKDNAGNISNCRVRVNVDIGYPTITLDAYPIGGNNTSILKNSAVKTTANSSNAKATINSGDYSDSALTNGYLNKTSAPGGVKYTITLNDSISLKNWKWETNKKDITSTTASNYNTVGSSNPDAKTGDCNNKKECTFDVSFTNDGLRKGVLTVYDKAGNMATYTIYANVDKTAPETPSIVNSTGGTGNWTNGTVKLTLGSTDSLSGIGEYYYTYNADSTTIATNNPDDQTQLVRLDGGSGKTSFTTTEWKSERNQKVYIRARDKAGNLSTASNTWIKIDLTAPSVPTLEGYKKNDENTVSDPTGLSKLDSGTWYKGYAVVFASGSTDPKINGSAGSGEVYYKLTTTGANANVTDSVQNHRNVNAQGESTISFKACDKVGNCSASASYIVRLDRTAPICGTATNASTTWTNSNRTIKQACSDSYSQCTKETFDTTYTETIKTDKVTIKDKAGNERECTYNVYVDKTKPAKPTITNPSNEEFVKDPFPLTLKSSDADSGISHYKYTYSSSATADGSDHDTHWVKYSNSSANTFVTSNFSAERNQLVYIESCDKAGNCSEKSKTYIKIDRTGPNCSISKSNTKTTSGVTVKVTCSDPSARGNAGSGCEWSSKTYTGVKSTTTYTVKDVLGNKGTCKAYIESYKCNCSNKLYNTTYSAGYCYNNKSGVNWVFGHPNSSATKCVSWPAQYNSDQGCCWYKSCKSTCYK